MNLYRVEADHFDYDNYDEFIIWAESNEEAIKLATDKANDASQRWTAHLVTAPTESRILLGSFNAG